jgi:hypothetical protein
MWRVLGLTMVFVVGATTAANANSRLDMSGSGIETALHQSAAVTGKGRRAPRTAGEALQLRVGDALALTQPSLRARLAGDDSRGYLAPPLSTAHEPAPAARRPATVRWLDAGDARPTLAYPVTDSLSLGLRYSYQRSEDLVFKVAKTGSLSDNYENHNVLLRAQWEF